MDAELSKQLFLYSMNKLGQKEAVDMFSKLVATGQIWNCPTTMLETAAVLVTSGTIGKKEARSDA